MVLAVRTRVRTQAMLQRGARVRTAHLLLNATARCALVRGVCARVRTGGENAAVVLAVRAGCARRERCCVVLRGCAPRTRADWQAGGRAVGRDDCALRNEHDGW